MTEPTENSPIDEYLGPLVEERLMELAERLGFKETPELVQAREKIKPDQLIDESRENIIAYQRLGEKVVEVGTDSADPKPQIGLIVALARLKYANGFNDAYRDDMANAALYATNIGEHELSLQLRRILNKDLKYRPMGN